MSAITAKASRKMKKYAVLTREPRCFLGSFDFSWEQRKLGEVSESYSGGTPSVSVKEYYGGQIPFIRSAEINSEITELFLTEEGLKNSSARLVAVGDILYALYGATSGEVGRARLKGAINQAILVIKPHTGYDSEYLAQWLRKSKHSIIETYLQGGQGNLSGTIVKELSVDFPSLKEQQVIGDFFRQLDNLIALHQRKCVFLFGFFQAFISMIFTASTFSWEQRKLGDVVQITMGQSPDGSTYSDEPSDYILVQGNADLQNGWVCPRIWTTQITKKADAGDLIMSVRAPAGAMGKTAYNAVIGRGVAAIKGNEFIYQLLVKMDMDGFWKTLSCGSTFESLNSDNIKNAEVKVPTTAEQVQIGDFFRHLDNLITLHQRECISFTARAGRLILTANKKRNTSSWEQRKFSDITFPAGEKNKDNLPLESYSITNEHGFVPQDEKFENGGTMREADKRMYYIVSPNSFAYNPARINVGSIGYQNIGKNVIVSSLYEVFKTSEDVDDRLLWHWFKSSDFQKLIMQLQEGGVRLYFYYDKLCMGEVSLPSLDEQRKIGKLFDTLDNLITLHQRKPFLMKWRTSDANRNQTNRLVL